MDSKILNGGLLILGTIVGFGAWFLVYPTDPSRETAVQAAELMGDANIAQVGIILGYGGMMAVIIGFLNMARGMQMAGGAGSACAGITAILSMSLIALMLGGAGLELGVTEATTAVGGVTLMGVALALLGAFPLALGLALIMFGIGNILQKKLHNIVAGLVVLVGVIMIVSPFVDIEVLEMGSFAGYGLVSIVLGVLKLRSAD